MRKSGTQRVVFQPAASRKMQAGIAQIVAPVRATLGPLGRTVAHETAFSHRAPELLDSGGIIARRIIALPDRDADVGAMFARQIIWRQHQEAGDGTAAAAVLFQSIYDAALRYLAAGGDVMELRRQLDRGLEVILDQLAQMAFPLENRAQLVHLAESVCHDAPLAQRLGEIFDTVGEYGLLEIRSGHGREMAHEYIDGAYWPSGAYSPEMLGGNGVVQLENAALLISDLAVETHEQIIPALEAALRGGFRSLLLVAKSFSAAVAGLLVMNMQAGLFRTLAVKTPGDFNTLPGALEDMAVLTGARPLLAAAGDVLNRTQPGDFGQAQWVWVDREHFGIVGGRGDPAALRQHILGLRSAYDRADDIAKRRDVRQRIGRLTGQAAGLWVGGAAETEIKSRREHAERTAEVLRSALHEGVLPGGGVALLACRPALQKRLAQTSTPDERAALHILLTALEAPARVIFTNAGYEASAVLAQIRQAGTGTGFDVIAGRVVDMKMAGILDSAAAVRSAVRHAVSGAAQALTIEALIHRKNPPQVLDPD